MAAVRLRGVASLADLIAQARALRDANPQWETRLVLYAVGEKRNARSRRLLTEEIAEGEPDRGLHAAGQLPVVCDSSQQ